MEKIFEKKIKKLDYHGKIELRDYLNQEILKEFPGEIRSRVQKALKTLDSMTEDEKHQRTLENIKILSGYCPKQLKTANNKYFGDSK